MNIDVHSLDGNAKETIELPKVFSSDYRGDLVLRALHSEQSQRFQPQAHSILAGFQTTALYVGKYSGYRRGRHMGIAIRPRQKLGGGAMGDVRRIPSSVKGHRAHPHRIEKIIAEEINKKEYIKAIESAIAGSANDELIKRSHHVTKKLPFVVEDGIEKIKKTRDLLKALNTLGFKAEIEASHKPKQLNSRSSRQRKFRKSLLIVVSNSSDVGKAGRNIAGIDVINIKELNIEALSPGGRPRPTLWSKAAVMGLDAALNEMKK